MVTRHRAPGEPHSLAESVAAPDHDAASESFADAGYADAFRLDIAGDIARFAVADHSARVELTTPRRPVPGRARAPAR